MSEFSLLAHLGVKVEGNTTTSVTQQSPAINRCRVWSPTRHPPTEHGAERKVPDRPIAKHVEPAGEVLFGRKDGKPVQFVVYNSKVPSIYGINKQLADKKREEKIKEANEGANASVNLYDLPDEDAEENARKQLLDSLYRSNLEQARRRKEEVAREKLKQKEREYLMLERMKNEEADQERQAAAKRNEAARRIDAENRRIADERKAERMARQSEDDKSWDGYFRSAEEGDAEREREKVSRLMEENRALAAQRQQERLLQNKRDLEYESAVQRYAERAMEREKSCELKKKAHERKLYEDLQRQAEERRALDKHESGDGLNFYPVSIDTESQLERKKKLEAVQKLQEENYKLAEQKRLQKRAEFEEELRRAKESTQNAAQAIEEEKKMNALKKKEERDELLRALEVAVKAKETQRDDERFTRGEFPEAFFREESDRLEAKEKERAFYRNVACEAERRKRDEQEKRAADKRAEKAAAEEDRRRSEAENVREKERRREKKIKNLLDLERQVQQKKLQHSAEERADLFIPEPLTPPEVLYRCPVTGKLFPASAFDFSTAA